MNLFERFIAQKAINDHDPWNLETHRLNTRRLEYKSGSITKFTIQKSIDETLNVLAWVSDVPDGIEGIRNLRSRFSQGLLRCIVSQELPFDLWELTLERAPCKL
jgi:hypothetical protein